VVTSNGVQYVTTPGQTVVVKGRRIRVAPQTVPLSTATQTTQPAWADGRRRHHVMDTSVATVVRTVSVPVTVAGPTTMTPRLLLTLESRWAYDPAVSTLRRLRWAEASIPTPARAVM
jgi:hypothetical protein